MSEENLTNVVFSFSFTCVKKYIRNERFLTLMSSSRGRGLTDVSRFLLLSQESDINGMNRGRSLTNMSKI